MPSILTLRYPLVNQHFASWNIPIFNRKFLDQYPFSEKKRKTTSFINGIIVIFFGGEIGLLHGQLFLSFPEKKGVHPRNLT